jgi:light-regulated signal transduction histidine kinase (bacteriophytochrome)
VGRVPDNATLRALGNLVVGKADGKIFTTDNLSAQFPPAAAFEHYAAGVMAIPIVSRANSFLYFFRDPWEHTREWAGDPTKPTSPSDPQGTLRPRASFDAWTEQVRGRCRKWTIDDVRVAEHLRVSLREVVFKKSDAVNLARLEASAKQDILIAELNHRVRNILGLVRGMVSQSHDGISHVEEFIESVSGRIHALARAHDQITAEQWSAAPLRKLIEAEAMAYLMPGHDRLMMTGPGVLLDPYSFPTVALVIHELMTNSAKYGALSILPGQIIVKWFIDDTGNLVIRWEERDGPTVQEPTRRGFGSTIIERSIPFDLKGSSKTEYAASGLRATFVIPAAYICVSDDLAGPVSAHRAVKLSQLHGDVLVLEDNLIIALDAEDILIRLGAGRVHTASTVAEALHIIGHAAITFALLDFDLGGDTSLEVALQLQAADVPFLFASGYGESLRLPAGLRDARVIRKPYNLESLREVEA